MFENKNTSELESNILFSDVPREFSARFANPKNIIGKREGDVIYQKGDSSEYFYLLIEGIVKLKRTEPNGVNTYIEKSKDSFFGETELLSKVPRKSSAVADTDCRMYTFNLSELISLMKTSPKVLENLQGNLTFNIPDEDFQDITSDFVNREAVTSEFSKTTEKISFDQLENEVNVSGENEENNAPESPDNETFTEQDGETTPEITDTKEEETTETFIPEDELIHEKEDNFIFEETADQETEEEEPDYFKISDPPRDEDFSAEMDLPDETGEEDEPELSLPDEKAEPEDEYKPSFTDIGFEDVEELPAPDENKEPETDSNAAEQEPDESETEIPEPTVANDTDTAGDPAEVENFDPPPAMHTQEITSTDRTSEFYKDIIKKIQNIFSSVNLDEVINVISEEAAELVNAEGGVLYIVDGENEELFTKILSGSSINDIRMKISDGLQGIAAAEKRNIFVDNPETEKYFNPVIEDLTGIRIKSALYYPLVRTNDETAAVLELYNSERGKFSQTDIEILDEISSSAIRAITNSRLTDILIRQKRMTSIGEITSFISEDIRNPLLLIKHYASLIKKKKPAKDISRALDLQIEQVSEIEDFLRISAAFSRNEKVIEPSTINIGDALNTTLGLLAEYVESRNTVIYRKIEADAVVNLDRGQFYQACYQIVKNACDEMDNDGKIYVTTEKDNDYLKIKFRDTGGGISESWKGKIFRPFVSRKKNRAGIGLTIAEKIIEDHGGYIMVDSRIGQGATFIIALPIVF